MCDVSSVLTLDELIYPILCGKIFISILSRTLACVYFPTFDCLHTRVIKFTTSNFISSQLDNEQKFAISARYDNVADDAPLQIL